MIIKKIWNAVVFLITFFFRLMHINLSEDRMKGFLQFVKFGIIGVSNTAVSYGIYLVVLFVLQNRNLYRNVDYLIANAAGFAISVLWSFYWNRKYVFHPEEGKTVLWWQALLKTYISYAFTGLFLNSVLSMLWIEWLGLSKVIAPILNIVINVPLNYLMNKFWAFRSK